jgi:hypothetical protein
VPEKRRLFGFIAFPLLTHSRINKRSVYELIGRYVTKCHSRKSGAGVIGFFTRGMKGRLEILN